MTTAAWEDRFTELLSAPAGAYVTATSTADDGTVTELHRFPIARHYRLIDDDGSGLPLLSYLQIGWNDGPAYQDLGEDYFNESLARSVCPARGRVDSNGDVLFDQPLGTDDDPWAHTVLVRISPCTETTSWIVDEWDTYRATLTDEDFHTRYVDRIVFDADQD